MQLIDVWYQWLIISMIKSVGLVFRGAITCLRVIYLAGAHSLILVQEPNFCHSCKLLISHLKINSSFLSQS